MSPKEYRENLKDAFKDENRYKYFEARFQSRAQSYTVAIVNKPKCWERVDNFANTLKGNYNNCVLELEYKKGKAVFAVFLGIHAPCDEHKKELEGIKTEVDKCLEGYKTKYFGNDYETASEVCGDIKKIVDNSIYDSSDFWKALEEYAKEKEHQNISIFGDLNRKNSLPSYCRTLKTYNMSFNMSPSKKNPTKKNILLILEIVQKMELQ